VVSLRKLCGASLIGTWGQKGDSDREAEQPVDKLYLGEGGPLAGLGTLEAPRACVKLTANLVRALIGFVDFRLFAGSLAAGSPAVADTAAVVGLP
jgi:hypothetical protein